MRNSSSVIRELRVKLLILSQEFPPGPGGLGTHAFEVARQLTMLGWDVRVVTNQDHVPDESIAGFNAAQPFGIRRLARRGGPLMSVLERWKVAGEELGRFRPDVMMATGDRANYLTAFLARKYTVPWVAIEHGCIPAGVERGIKRWAYAQADALVCVSDYTWRQAEAMGVRPKRVEVIPNGADAARFRCLQGEEIATVKENLGLARNRILLTVGAVTHRKGQDTVIRALPRIREQVRDVVYLCAGIGLVSRQFQALACDLGVGDAVRFLGPVGNDEVVQLMNASDIFLMTSRHTGGEFEGYGIAAVEAALCGKPCVVTADSGLGEAILEGVTGFGVPQDDPESVTAAVLRLLQDDALRKKMGAAARARALSEQTWDSRIRRYDVLFRELAGFPAIERASEPDPAGIR